MKITSRGITYQNGTDCMNRYQKFVKDWWASPAANAYRGGPKSERRARMSAASKIIGAEFRRLGLYKGPKAKKKK